MPAFRSLALAAMLLPLLGTATLAETETLRVRNRLPHDTSIH